GCDHGPLRRGRAVPRRGGVLGARRDRRVAGPARVRHRGGREVVRGAAPRPGGDGAARPRPQRRVAGARREHPAQAGARPAAAGEARRHSGAEVRPPDAGGDRRGRGTGVSGGGAGAAGDDGPRRADRRPPREDAAEVDVLLPEAPDRDGVQLAQEGLTVSRRSTRDEPEDEPDDWSDGYDAYRDYDPDDPDTYPEGVYVDDDD